MEEGKIVALRIYGGQAVYLTQDYSVNLLELYADGSKAAFDKDGNLVREWPSGEIFWLTTRGRKS